MSIDYWKLVSKETGEEVKLGAKVKSFRGEEYIYTGGRSPHKPSSVGLIYVCSKLGEVTDAYYPSVFNLKWEKEDE